MRKLFRSVFAVVSAALFFAAVPVAAETFHVFVLTGQSNSLGAIKGNFADAEKMRPAPAKVLFWHENFGSYCTGADSAAWERVAPQREGDLVMGPEYGFARALESGVAKRCGLLPRRCGILKVSRDGGGNAHWAAPRGEAYGKILAAAKRAFSALPALGFDAVEIEALLYLQGESDSPSEIPLAGTRVVALRENLLRDLCALRVDGLKRISAARTALLVGEPANFFGKEKRAADGGTSAENLRKATRSARLAAWIPTRDLPKIAFGDNLGVHYDGNAQLVVGARFAEAFAALRETSER